MLNGCIPEKKNIEKGYVKYSKTCGLNYFHFHADEEFESTAFEVSDLLCDLKSETQAWLDNGRIFTFFDFLRKPGLLGSP